MINYSYFVMFVNKINRQTTITLESVQQKKLIHLQFNMRLTRAPDAQSQLKTAFHSVKIFISISYPV